MKCFYLLYCFIAMLPLSLFAQDSLITAYVQKHVYPLTFENGTLSGKGADFLEQAAQSSPFFLIGEDHGIAEIPLFTAALLHTIRQHGYQYFATETGPITANFLQQAASKPNWQEAYAEFLTSYPWSIPFYSLKEECTILDALFEQQPSDYRLLWGLDQEFAGSYRLNFQQLATNAQTEASRQVAEAFFDRAMAAYDASFVKKNPQRSFLATVTADDFTELKNAFKGQDDNLDQIRQLEESTNIYRLWYQGKGYQSNYQRAEMMKRHFLHYYSEAKARDQQQPKVLFKFGANHMYRGLNGLNVSDIGNFVSEIASQMGTTSFHLYTIGRQGTKNAFTPFSQSEADKQKPYNYKDYLDRVDFSPLLAAANQGWAIVDLRPLREALFNNIIKEMHPGLEKVVWSYDAVLVIPEVHASTNF